MSTPNHTPGPWIIRTRQNLTAICTPKGEMQLSLHGVHDGLKPLSISFQEWLANAHLIAAAPAMYEALVNIANAGQRGPLRCTDFYAITQHARAALAQAEGGES